MAVAPGTRKALIIGALGQDGHYLTQRLLAEGYRVTGTTHLSPGSRDSAAYPGTLRQLDLAREDQVRDLVRELQADEIYNLGARASSEHLFDDATRTGDINGLAVTRLLEAIRQFSPQSRLCQALSSEIFAGCSTSPQDEQTPIAPVNAYGAAKAYALHMVRAYRARHGLHACGAILYNHESPRRGAHFVTRKVTLCAAKIALGSGEKLQLGNPAHRRDWGHARDHVRAMHLMLQHPEPDDYVVATGVTHSIEDLCRVAFGRVGLDYRDHVVFGGDPARRAEPVVLRGDAAKAHRILGWVPEVGFEHLIEEMVTADLELQRGAMGAAPSSPG